ncbi:MAG: hypothetical protein QM504_03445 [Pseudomonadota bacterium]
MSINNPEALTTLNLDIGFLDDASLSDLPFDIEQKLNNAKDSNMSYIRPQDIMRCLSGKDDNKILEMPIGTYTSNSFNKEVKELIKSSNIAFNMSHIVDTEVPARANYYNCLILDCKLPHGGVVEHSNLFDSSLLNNHRVLSFNREKKTKRDEFNLFINKAVILNSNIDNGAYVTNSNIIESNTEHVCFAHNCTIQRGVHGNVYIEKEGLKVINGKDLNHFNSNLIEVIKLFLPDFISNEELMRGTYSTTELKLSSFTEYLPHINYYNPAGIGVKQQDHVEDINDKASYGKKRKFDNYSEIEVARIIKAIYVYANTETLGKVNGIDITSIYTHSNNSIDVAKKVNRATGDRDVLGVSKDSSLHVQILKKSYDDYIKKINDVIVDNDGEDILNSYSSTEELSKGAVDIFGAVDSNMYENLLHKADKMRRALAKAIVADEIEIDNVVTVQNDLFAEEDVLLEVDILKMNSESDGERLVSGIDERSRKTASYLKSTQIIIQEEMFIAEKHNYNNIKGGNEVNSFTKPDNQSVNENFIVKNIQNELFGPPTITDNVDIEVINEGLAPC